MCPRERKLFYNQLLEVSILSTTEDFSKVMSKYPETGVDGFNWILEEAIKKKDIQIIKFLLEFGIGIYDLNDKKQTAIHLAANLGFLDVVEYLFSFSNKDRNSVDTEGLSHFHVACMLGNLELVKNFLQIGVDINHCCQNSSEYRFAQFSPLHFAVQNVRLEVVELLLRNGADPNSTDSSGMTPLHWTCPGISKRMRSLIKRQDFLFNESILDAFLESHDELKIVELMVAFGGDIEVKDALGNTPLLCIFQEDYIEQINSMFHPFICDVRLKWKVINEIKKRQGEKLDFLLQSGASVNAWNNNGDTTLHLVIKAMGFSRRPKALPDINLNDSLGVDVIEMLLGYGADVNIKNQNKKTPLQLAVSILSFDVIVLLLEHGAEIKNIVLDPANEELFQYYANVVPCFEATDNLIRIIELLQINGLQLKEVTLIKVLEFLVKNGQGWPLDLEDKNFLFKLRNFLELGTELDVLEALKATPVSPRKSDFFEQSMKDQMMVQMKEHLLVFGRGCFFMSEEIRNCIERKLSNYNMDFPRFLIWQKHLEKKFNENLDQELELMKITMLDKTTSLHDLLRMDLHQTYSYLKSEHFRSILESEDFDTNFILCGGIIKGHLAKSLVRRYVTRSALGFLKTMASMKLPDLCCERICSYLNNQSLFDLCLAALEVRQSRKGA